MYKRILVLSFVFMLAFSPMSAIAAEVDEANDRPENEEVDSREATTGEESDEEEASEEGTDDEADTEYEADEAGEEPGEELETGETVEEESDANTEEVEAEEEEEEISTLATDDEDLNLKDIHGTANGDIEYDITSGNYVLGLQAGLSNYAGNQDIENKWVGFAIPNGVRVAGDLHIGVVPIFIAVVRGVSDTVTNILSN